MTNLPTIDELDGNPRSIRPVHFNRVDYFTTLFAEWDFREKDILLHVFPRAGKDDQWKEGRYLPKCRNCGTGMSIEKPYAKCPNCRKVGLAYAPGRTEDKPTVLFPANMTVILKRAVDKVWLGDVAIEEIPELGAYVVQFQNAKNTVSLVGLPKFMDTICQEIDVLLEKN